VTDNSEQLQPRVAVVFDFDGTIAPDSASGFLRFRGFDAERFWKVDVQARMDEGWDPVPAYLYELWKLSSKGSPITRSDFVEFGRYITDPQNIQVISQTSMTGSKYSLAVTSDSLITIASGNTGLHFYDADNPYHPQFLTTLSLQLLARQIPSSLPITVLFSIINPSQPVM